MNALGNITHPLVGRRLLWLAGGLVLLLGCTPTGAYRVDIMREMHYQISYRSQEPPRLDSPAGAVPVTGGERSYTLSEATALTNPVPPGKESLERAARLYQVNCSACHGPKGRGDGVVSGFFVQANTPPPIDLASERVRSRTEGQLFWFITNGLGNMPPFRKLLTEEERWTVIQFIHQVQAQ
ncbi:MAG: cytochrome c [Chloroflexi bacterium]|nr:cytochrome c [Chloroflexota bacterium]